MNEGTLLQKAVLAVPVTMGTHTMTFSMVAASSGVNESEVVSSGGGSENEAERFVYISEAIIIPVILAVGVISNCFSLMILPRASIAPSFKTCLLALTTSDLFAGLVGFLQMMVEITAFSGNIRWGKWHPLAVTSFSLYYIFSWLIGTSSAIVIAIVAIRHYTISNPMTAKMRITSKTARMVCVGILLGTLVIFAPTTLMILWQSCHRETTVSICVKVNKVIPNLRYIALTYLLSVTILYGPVLVIIYVCCMIGIRINLEKTENILENLQEDVKTPLGNSDRKSRRRTTMKITKTLLLILLLDTICSLPLVVQAFAMVIAPKKTVFSTTNKSYQVFDSVAEIFLVSRQAYNFWLYAFSHKSFRERAKTLFLCMCVPKYRELWKSPSLRRDHRERVDRRSSATSGRLQTLDADTDATWVKAYELKGLEGERRDSSKSQQSNKIIDCQNKPAEKSSLLVNGKKKRLSSKTCTDMCETQ